MIFQIDPINLIKVLTQLKPAQKGSGKHTWIETNKYNEVNFCNLKENITIQTQVIGSGKVRINSSEISHLKNSLKFEETVEFTTEDPYLSIKQGTFLLKFNYLTEYLEEQRKQIIKERKLADKELARLNKQLKALK